ncbi:elongation of very long chain fatty acids protein 1-like [Oppia nitens]|uniref:elongation of very long chain fatty acids protein 1-like n=1 Tax=Oppia nitens TaxID=1686743 RepID=UPI0023DA1926|nr:elongation of very long chain fatty acids protein 1-like [Oppia nitens]
MSSSAQLIINTTKTATSAQTDYGIDYYRHQYWDDRCDPRTVDLPLMNGGPWNLAAILLVYFVFVTKIGPKWMANRKPYELRLPMLIYNIVMVAINAYFLYESLIWIEFGPRLFNFKFPDNREQSEATMRVVRMFHYYMFTKFIDFFDTFFFVLRKKDNQITVLHIYHHVSVPIIGWISAWVSPLMPVLGLFALLNCFCHVLMYSYYALAAFGPAIQPYLWWKRYITQIQMIQFAIIGIYGAILSAYHVDYPLFYRLMPTSQGPIFFAMFANFYIKSYRRKHRSTNSITDKQQKQQQLKSDEKYKTN